MTNTTLSFQSSKKTQSRGEFDEWKRIVRSKRRAVTVKNFHSKRSLYLTRWSGDAFSGCGAKRGAGWENTFRWRFLESPCPSVLHENAQDTNDDRCWLFLNADTNRRYFAQKGKTEKDGLGAVEHKKSNIQYDDQKWKLKYSTDCNCWRIVNAFSGRSLFARSNGKGESSMGASSGAVGETFWDDQKWRIRGEPREREEEITIVNEGSRRWAYTSPAPATAPPQTGCGAKKDGSHMAEFVFIKRQEECPTSQHVNANAVDSECFAVVNKESKRRLFAKRGGSGKSGFGAVADAPRCSVIAHETYEDGEKDLAGWKNGRMESGGHLTTFLGRFGSDLPVPEKTYALATNTESVDIEFDFYQIDSWDGGSKWGPDKFIVEVNGKNVDLGAFGMRDSETTEEGTSPDGIKWTTSKGPAEKVFGTEHWTDKIIKVTMSVPRTVLGMQLTLKFIVDTNEGYLNEAAGIDNLKITGCGAPDKPVCLKFAEDYEDGGAAGWKNAKVEDNGALSKFLGPFGSDTPVPEKTFEVPTNADSADIEFDFYQLDSWDGNNRWGPDKFLVDVNGKRVDLGFFGMADASGLDSGTSPDGIKWTTKKGPYEKVYGHDRWHDKRIAVTMHVPKAVVGSGVTIKFIVDTNEGVENEAAGIDNVKFKSCGPPPPPVARCMYIADEDYESDKDLVGWTNGKVEGAGGSLTTFLGRFGSDLPVPQKTWQLPANAASADISFDFYQIDSWDGNSAKWGPGKFGVELNSKLVDVGAFGMGDAKGCVCGSSQ